MSSYSNCILECGDFDFSSMGKKPPTSTKYVVCLL